MRTHSEDGQGPATLEVSNLDVKFYLEAGVGDAVRNVSFRVRKGETVALVGESGSGKSVTARALMGLIEAPGRISAGSIRLNGEELVGLDPKRLRKLRGPSIAMVFQDSLSALNPVFTIGQQLSEIFRAHEGTSRAEAKRRSIELLDQVRIPDAARRFGQYPHEFSGGMRQRAMIAMSIALSPDILIADEPTTALDVTVQAQIMSLLAELRRERDMGVILITHDLGLVAQHADRVAVMYAGQIVEEAETRTLFKHSAHGYTHALLGAIPNARIAGDRLVTIPGSAPQILGRSPGCAFATRCAFATELCLSEDPTQLSVGPEHLASCHEWKRVQDAL